MYWVRLWVLVTWYGDEQIETLEHVHLLESTRVDKGVDLALTAAVQQL